MTFRLCFRIVMGTSFLHISVEKRLYAQAWLGQKMSVVKYVLLPNAGVLQYRFYLYYILFSESDGNISRVQLPRRRSAVRGTFPSWLHRSRVSSFCWWIRGWHKRESTQGIHPGFAPQGRRHQKSKNRGISGLTKRTYVLQKLKKKKKEVISAEVVYFINERWSYLSGKVSEFDFATWNTSLEIFNFCTNDLCAFVGIKKKNFKEK